MEARTRTFMSAWDETAEQNACVERFSVWQCLRLTGAAEEVHCYYDDHCHSEQYPFKVRSRRSVEARRMQLRNCFLDKVDKEMHSNGTLGTVHGGKKRCWHTRP